MKKLEEIKLLEVEALSEFQEHIGLVLADMEEYGEYIDNKERKSYQKCYTYLDNLWEKIEEVIMKLCEADERNK